MSAPAPTEAVDAIAEPVTTFACQTCGGPLRRLPDRSDWNGKKVVVQKRYRCTTCSGDGAEEAVYG